MNDLLNMIAQGLILAGMSFAILALFAMIGLWPVLHLLPRKEALRWPIYSPVVGMALLSVIGTPLALGGLPVGRWAVALALGGLLLGGAAIVKGLRSRAGRKLLWSYLRLRRWTLAISFVVPIAVSTFLIVGAKPGAHVLAVWGTVDYGTYWGLADYLRGNAATLDGYLEQTTFFSPDIEAHLTTHARLGCLVLLSFLGTVLSPESIRAVINPMMVAGIILMLLVTYRWLELERMRGQWLYVPLLAYPYLYFLLYFSYASQVIGVLMAVLCLVWVGSNEPRANSDRARDLALPMLGGVLAGAALLNYPSMVVPFALCGAMQFIRGARFRKFAQPLAWSAGLLAASGFYLPKTLRELIWLNGRSELPGWEWDGLVGALEFLGIRPLLGFGLPAPRGPVLEVVEIVLSAGLLALLLRGIFLARLRCAAVTIAGTTLVLVGGALVKYAQNIPNATHAFVKTLSTFAPWLLVICLLPLARHVVSTKSSPVRYLAVVLGIVATSTELAAIYRSKPQVPWFSEALVALSRRQIDQGYDVAFGGLIPVQIAAPVVKDVRRWIPEVRPGADEPTAIVYVGRRVPADYRHRIGDAEGEYVAVRLGASGRD